MSAELRVTNTIRVSEGAGQPWLFTKECKSVGEYSRVANLCSYNARKCSWEGQFVVVRTDTIGNFCKDLFFPGAIAALKIKEFGLKILTVIVSAVIDFATLPIRCITLIPRWLYNRYHAKESHPFYRYLVENRADQRLLNHAQLYVRNTAIFQGSLNGRDEQDFYLTLYEIPEHERL